MSEGNHSSIPDKLPDHERLVLLILAAVQFATILDFMIVMPLGPQLMRKLSIGPTDFGLVVSSYTFSAGIAGLVASAFVDRFSRRSAFIVLYVGFLVGTLLCGLAANYTALVLARTVTGAFGGILGGLSMAIIGDVFPESRRGRATASLMTGFALASVAGVPLGLFIGTNFGWHMTFILLAVGGIPWLLLALYALPVLDSHIGKNANPIRSLGTVFFHANHLNAFALIIALTVSSFLIFPFLSVYLVNNIGMQEQHLPVLYIFGGALTLVAAPIVGRYSDRHGKLLVFRVIAPASATLMLVITHQAIGGSVALAVVVFGCLMVCNVGRMIPAMAMVTSSVAPQFRGAFLSANSSIQHITGGIGAYLGGFIVVQAGDGHLERYNLVGWLAAILAFSSLWLAGRLRSAEYQQVSAESISLPAAAEAAVDAGEALVVSCEAKTQ